MAANYERLGRSVLDLETDQSGLDQGLAQAKAKAEGFTAQAAASLTSLGAAMTKTGRTMTTNVTLPIVAAGAAVFHFGSNFEETMGQIVGLAGVPKSAIGGIREEILGMAEDVGRTPQELAEAFYFVASAGFEADEAMEVLRTSAMGAAAGLGNTQDVAKVLGLTINAYGKENITAARAADVLVAAVREGTAEASDMASVLGTVVPTAAQLGVGFDQVTAALAGMTLSGLSAEEASVSLNQVMLSLLKPTVQAEKAMGDLGLSSAELRKQLREQGLLSVLRTLEDRFEGNEEAASLVFGNVRALRGALSLLGLDSEQLNDIFADTEGALGDLAGAYEATEGPAREAARANAAIQVELIRLGEDVLPMVVSVLRGAVDIVKAISGAFRSLPEPVRSTIVQLLAVAAVAGPLVLVLGKLASGVGLLLTGFGMLDRNLPRIIAGLGRLRVAMAAAMAGSALVQSLSTGLSMALGQVTGSRLVTGAAGRLGAFMGTTVGAAFSVAFAAAAVAAVIVVYDQVRQGVQQQSADLAAQTAKFVQEASLKALMDARAGVEAELARQGSDPIAEFLGLSAKPAILNTLDQLNREIAERTVNSLAAPIRQARVEAMEEISSGTPQLSAAMREQAGTAVAAWGQEVLARAPELVQTAQDTALAAVKAFGDGIVSARQLATDAWETLLQRIKEAPTAAQEAAKLTGRLIGKTLADALNDSRPEVVAQAIYTKDAMLGQLEETVARSGTLSRRSAAKIRDGLKSENPTIKKNAEDARMAFLRGLERYVEGGGKLSRSAAREIERGIKSKNSEISAASRRIKALAEAPLRQLQGQTRGYGSRTMGAYISGILSRIWEIQRAARLAAGAVRGALRADSPPVVTSPLHDIPKWGFRTMEAYYLALLSAADRYNPRLRGVLRGIGGLFGSQRLGVPLGDVGGAMAAAAGAGSPSAMAALQAAAPPGSSTVVNLRTYGTPMYAPTPADVVRRIRRASRLGTVAPPPRQPHWEPST